MKYSKSPQTMALLLATTIASLCLMAAVNAYPEYVPYSACDSMQPGHHMNKTSYLPLIEAQRGDPYFSIHVDNYKISPGDTVTVQIQADQHYFEGFLIQAHGNYETIWDPTPPTKHGQFVVYMDDVQLACDGKAVSHSVHKHYDSAIFSWVAPMDIWEETPVHFTATIVKGYTTFFKDVKSETVWIYPSETHSSSARQVPLAAGVLTIMAMITRYLF